MKYMIFFFIFFYFLISTSLHATTYTIHPDKSNLTFIIQHIGRSEVNAHFESIQSTLNYVQATPELSSVETIIDINSIKTGVRMRDKNILKHKKYFHEKVFPNSTFKSSNIQLQQDGSYLVYGNLTIKDIQSTIILKGQLTEQDDGSILVTFSTELNRLNFNITAHKRMVGHLVKIKINALYLPIQEPG